MTREATARAAVKQLMGDVDASRFEYLSGGYSNLNYRFDVAGESYVVRVVEIAAPEKVREVEHEFLEHGLGPEVVAFDHISGTLVSRWIDGKLIADKAPSPQEGGRYLAELHAQIPTGVHTYDLQKVVTAYLSGSAHPDAVQRALAANWQPALRVGCHNDLNPWNVIRGRERWYTLDWEFAGDNDPLFDIVTFTFGLDWDEDETWECIASYGLKVDEERLEDTRRAFYLREYAWAVAQLLRGNVRDEIVEQRDDMLALL